MKMKVTCPESAHLEEIEFERDPIDGHILGATRCTAFGDQSPTCNCLCIKRLNQRFDAMQRRPPRDEAEKPEINEEPER